MKRAGQQSVQALESEFDEFLYASIGVENDGAFPSVLSALARLNVDPWDEAARLARLPRAAASRFLATLICAQPGVPGARVDPEMQAERLTALLPCHAAGNSRCDHPISAQIIGDRSRLIRYALYYAVLAMVFFGSQWIVQNLRGDTSPGATAVATTGAELSPTPNQTSAPSAAPNRD